MDKTQLPKLITILSLITLLLLPLYFQTTLSLEDEEKDDDQEYVLDDDPIDLNHSSLTTRSRFLKTSIKKTFTKGTRCNAKTNPYVCNGVWANKGTSLLYCCKTHCRNVLGDQNNCGRCGNKCQQGERCCGGTCINVFGDDKNNCGKCNKKCGHGVKCEYGYCGYA